MGDLIFLKQGGGERGIEGEGVREDDEYRVLVERRFPDLDDIEGVLGRVVEKRFKLFVKLLRKLFGGGLGAVVAVSSSVGDNERSSSWRSSDDVLRRPPCCETSGVSCSHSSDLELSDGFEGDGKGCRGSTTVTAMASLEWFADVLSSVVSTLEVSDVELVSVAASLR